jgi:DNA-binding response OmpR family regulator
MWSKRPTTGATRQHLGDTEAFDAAVLDLGLPVLDG